MDTGIQTSGEALYLINGIREKMSEKIIGQQKLIDGIITAYIAGGHVLLEGAPGLAKTLAVKTFASICGYSFKRIQFTPDLLPADLIGTLVFRQNMGRFSVRKGPLFANIILADEINRAPAKVQSALLEAMAEKQVTIGKSTYKLPLPFFVLATQNPIEQEGTYPLPEAETDRFMLKLIVPYPDTDEEVLITDKFSSMMSEDCGISCISEGMDKDEKNERTAFIPPQTLFQLRKYADGIKCSSDVISYIVSIVAATRPSTDFSENIFSQKSYLSYISFGASPRASIAIKKCAKVKALLEGRNYVIPEDVKYAAYPALRHRLKLSYEASAENLNADSIIEKILNIVPQP